ncbi:AAA domain-containing protein [Geodermatophilus africanus]|uniref:AAA domain-containing protein n=2 Tax=Geodermatophilus africanus TaxID=1137993 RepID=A0A1H3KDI7_9ACTN|nr:AAA domain-containing protein [Geodermatophilus africanus]
MRPPWLLPRSELASLPSPESLIAETLDCDTVAVLAGPTGTAKSLLALQWGVAVATGGSWLGRTAKAGPVVFVAAEGVAGLHRRLKAHEQHTGRSVPDTFWVVPAPVELANVAETAGFIDGVARLRPRMVIFDTLARCMVGQDENSALAMGIVIDNAYRVRDALDRGVVLLVHHTGKDRHVVRGSSALVSGVDTVYQTSLNRGVVRLERYKRKDGPREDQLAFGFLPVADSVVLEAAPREQRVQAERTPVMRRSLSEEQLRRSILRVVTEQPGVLKVRGIREAVTGSAERVGRMIDQLVGEGALSRDSTGCHSVVS